MKDVRRLLPHRSNSVVQDWITKGIASASTREGGRGTGNRWQFTLYQLWDLMLVDQLSALRVFDKPYVGKNYSEQEPENGNVLEIFYYADLTESVSKEKREPKQRNRQYAIDFYRTFGRHVLVIVALMRRVLPQFLPTKGSRKKEGMLYYNVSYWPEDLRHYQTQSSKIGGITSGLGEHRVLHEIVGAWRKGEIVGKGPTLALISLDLLVRHVELTLGLPDHW